MRNTVFEDIDPEELEQPLPEPKWKKPVLIAGSIVLLLLFSSLSFLDAAIGIIQSATIDEQVLLFPSDTVRFTNNTLERVQQELLGNEHREIKACLFGSKNGDEYVVRDVSFPEVIRANVVHVVSVGCPYNTMIDLHSHPIHSCIASSQDLETYEKNKQSNPGLRMMIMCSRERFALI